MSSFYGCGGGPGSGGSGPAGVGIKSATINEKGELIFVYTDNRVQNLGVVEGTDGGTFVPVITNNVLTWVNDKGLPNPKPLDFNEVLANNNEGDYWQEIEEVVDTLGWGSLDDQTASATDTDYMWGTF